MEKLSGRVLWLIGCILLVAHLSAAELEPLKMIQYKGEPVPIFSAKEVPVQKRVQPSFPREGRVKQVGGAALVMVLVSEKGKVLELEVRDSSPLPDFGFAAKEALRQWRFGVVKLNGTATKYFVEIPMAFTIN